MRFFKDKHKRNRFICAMSLVIILMVMILFCLVYLNDYYRADSEAIDSFEPTNSVTSKTLEDGTIVFEPEEVTAGFIFYPGGKVEHTAYVPLMEACASEGILCVLVEMPFRLAVFDLYAADGIQELYPNVDKWYMGGHSLGGSMAAAYVSKNAVAFDGLVLLGSYSTADLSDTSLDVLSVYGSEDKVLNLEKYDEYKENLPNDFMEKVVTGGCHAYFGMYGEQEGDGMPAISNEEQIRQTVLEIMKLVDSE